MNSFGFENIEPTVTKRLTVFDDDDYEVLEKKFKETEEKEKIPTKVVHRYPQARTFILKENFDDSKCPKCDCPTIANVVDEVTNQFILQCANCDLKFVAEVYN